MRLESKLPDIGTTIFTVMSQLAQRTGAINLGQGFPDFDPPAELIEALGRYAREGHNQYPPMMGVAPLREQIAALIARSYQRSVDADREITVTSGATEALFAAMAAVLRAGDEVIVFDPAYDAYDPAARLQGARVVHLPMEGPGFAIDWDRVADTIGGRTRLIVINSPHNPTGRTLKRPDLEALAHLVETNDLWVLSDEVYEHIVFDGTAHESVLRYDDLWSRSLVVSSFGKTFHATGWKVGYCAAPEPLTTEFRKVHQFLTFTTMTPAQFALAEYLAGGGSHVEELGAFYQAKRDTFRAALAQSRFRLFASEGTYFQLVDYAPISDEPDVQFAERLTTDYGVAAIPLSPFYKNSARAGRCVRFCFAKDDATLSRAGEVLCRI